MAMIFETTNQDCSAKRDIYFKYASDFLLIDANEYLSIPAEYEDDEIEYSFSFPQEESSEPVLLTGHAVPLTNLCLFTLIGGELDRNGWDNLDTGNWTTCVFGEADDLRVRLRKLSPAQHARARDKFFYGEKFIKPIVQFQVTSLGQWPTDDLFFLADSARNEARMVEALGHLH
jgi:hypothetical protein